MRHVLGLERVGADRARDGGQRPPGGPGLAGEVEAPARQRRDGGGGDERRPQRHEGRQRRRGLAEEPRRRQEGDERRQPHGAAAHRVDVVEVGALELDAGRRQAERLVDGEVRHHGAEPGHRHHGEERQDALQRRVDAEFHEEQRDGDVEHQPHHPARVRMGEAGEDVGPGERARIGVHDVDLELRHDDEARRQQRHGLGAAEHVPEGDAVHLGRVGGMVGRHAGAQGQHGEQRAEEQLRGAEHDPARAGGEQRQPPGAGGAARRGAGGQEAQHVHLLADLRHQRQDDGGGAAELQEVEAPGPRGQAEPAEARPGRDGGPVVPRDEADGQEVQPDPQRLGEELEAADPGDAVRHQRDHGEGADEVADRQRHAEDELQRARHDRPLDGEEHEGEGGVDQRRDGGADVAEAGAPGEQVDVDPVARRHDADGQAGEEQHDAHHEGGGEHVGEAVGEGDAAPDGFQRQERDGAQRRLRHARRRPAPRRLGGEAQREVLQRLVGDPSVVVAPDGQDALASGHVSPMREMQVMGRRGAGWEGGWGGGGRNWP